MILRRATRAAGSLVLPCAAVAIWAVAVAYPLVCLARLLSNAPDNPGAAGHQPLPEFHGLGDLLGTSAGWAIAVAVGAAAAGWLPGRVLGAAATGGRRGFVPMAALVMVPVCLPAYIVFYAWWQSWPIDTALHRWVIQHHSMQLARDVTLYLGLVCWSWPLVALCVAGAAARRPRERDEMLLIDGAPWHVRMRDRLRTDAPGLLLGMLLALLATLNNTTCFDLAEVFTFANELRARASLGASPTEVLRAAGPMIAIAAGGAVIVWWCLGCRSEGLPWRTRAASRGAVVFSVVLWLATAVGPLALFGRGMAASGDAGAAIAEFFSIYRGNLLATLAFALLSAVLAMLAGIGLAAIWHSDRVALRLLAHIVSITWLMAALVPATVLGLALHQAYDGLFMGSPGHQGGGGGALAAVHPLMLNIAHLGSAGFVAVLLARWSAASEARALHDLRRIDGAFSPAALWHTARPTFLATALATLAIVTVLAVGEIAVTAQVQPPMGVEWIPLATTLLNDMHYQRPQSVLVAAVVMMLLSLGAAILAAILWRTTTLRLLERARSAAAAAGTTALWLAAAAPAIVLAGCAGSDPDNLPPLDQEFAFGAPGQSLGQFGYPRCIDVDGVKGWVYVIDKTARVQRFGLDGRPQLQWSMPERENGKPTGVSVGPNGHVYVADTHYSRILEYHPDGALVRSFGSQGEGPGQFIYVTDVAFGADGNLYVSEYGGHDRIQVFTPAGEYLFEFGAFGTEPGQFRRPQSLAFSHDGRELYIADACNHRIVVTDPRGQVVRTFGSAGRGLGQLVYPYSVAVLPDDTLLVCEFGNNRIQRFTRGGESLGMYGRVGRGEGELQYPWAVAATGDRIFVLDSGNNRVQVMEMF